ncbi:hypothetical protein Hanom_Chr08g00740521 [Helianthus anomalus]
MVPLPGNSKLVQTRYSSCDQVVLASQLASIASNIDSMRKDIAEIRMAWMDENNVARGLHLCGRTRLGYLSGTETPWVLVGDVS